MRSKLRIETGDPGLFFYDCRNGESSSDSYGLSRTREKGGEG